MQHKPTTHPAEKQVSYSQDELHELLKEYRKVNQHEDVEWAIILDDLFDKGISYWAEAYQQNCFELIELLTDADVQRKLRFPNDHIRMVSRFLLFVTSVRQDIDRYSSYIDNGLMETGILPPESLEPIEQRWKTMYNPQIR